MIDGLRAAPCSDAALGSAQAPPEGSSRPDSAPELGTAALAPPQGCSLLLQLVLPACLPLVRVTPFIPACARVPTLRSIQPLAQGTADRQHGSCGSQGDKTAGSHSPTSHDLAELPKMEMGLVPPLGDIGAGARGWTVQVAEE